MNLVQQLSQVARNSMEDTAYIFADKGTTYGELEHLVNVFGDGLLKLGIKKGDHVAFILGNTPHFIIGLYGALKIGATVIPINPTYMPDEIAYMIENGDVKAVITLDVFEPIVKQMLPTLPTVETVILCETGAPIQLSDEKMKTFTNLMGLGENINHEVELADDDVAVILYTSGTTGKPKGAMLTHKNLYSNAMDVGEYLNYTSQDKIIATLPVFHVFCLTVVVNASLMKGATIILLPKFSPTEVFRSIKEYEATIFAGVPTMFNFLYQTPGEHVEDLKTLRVCISGGSSLPVALLYSFEKKFNVVVSEGYGLSEASPVSCFNPLNRPTKPGSIGQSVVNVENKVVDELGDEVPPGEVGELIIRGPNVMKGYYKMPEDTQKTIKDGWLYTGDLARMDDEGYFYIVDRKKEMIIVGGFNVYPREVEEILYNHPSIIEAAVIGVPDENYGEIIKCFVVSKDLALTSQQVMEYCKGHLSAYKVPSTVEFIEELPKNTTGKILRKALTEMVSK